MIERERRIREELREEEKFAKEREQMALQYEQESRKQIEREVVYCLFLCLICYRLLQNINEDGCAFYLVPPLSWLCASIQNWVEMSHTRFFYKKPSSRPRTRELR